MSRSGFTRLLGRLLPALFVGLAACAAIPDSIRELPTAAPIELAATPFYPQARFQCGPAALTTLLNASGVDADLEAMVEKVYLPGREGSLQFELLAATRTSGRIPYTVDPRLAAIQAELSAARPVLVMQNLGVRWYPRWHYAVVVGIDPARERVILRSGTERRLEMQSDTFLRTWRRSGYWGYVALAPGEIPAGVDRARFLKAVADFEAAGQAMSAAAAWQAALARWPGDPTAGFGLANTLAATGRHAEAVSRFDELLQRGGSAVVVRNNLALSLAELGRFDRALAEIERALADNSDPALLAELEDTRESIRRRASR